MLLGEKIRNLRIERGMSQEELAFKLDTSRQTVSSWENDKTYPSIEFIIELADLFEKSIQTLIEEDVVNMKKVLNNDLDKVVKNKNREVIGKLVYLRTICVLAGALFIFPVHEYLEPFYLFIPVILLVIGVIITIPIEVYRKKYSLRNYQDIVAFFDEKYS